MVEGQGRAEGGGLVAVERAIELLALEELLGRLVRVRGRGRVTVRAAWSGLGLGLSLSSVWGRS